MCLAAMGACAFWLPDVIAHGAARARFDSHDVLVLTVLMPTLAAAAYLILRRRSGKSALAWPMLAAVWLSTGVFIMAGAMWSETFANSLGFAVLSVVMGAVPVYAWILATYDGSLGALVIVTIALGAWGLVERRSTSTQRIHPSISKS